MFGSALDNQQHSPAMKVFIFSVLFGLCVAELPHQLFPFQHGQTVPLLYNEYSATNHLSFGQKGAGFPLDSTPDISHYDKLIYPKLTVIDLGEIHYAKHTPEIVKIEKKVQVNVPAPFPVKVPHEVPYPVAFKVPQIIKVPQVITIAQPVPVEVVKEVPVPHSQQAPGYHQTGTQLQGNGAYETEEPSVEGAYQSDWKGLSTSHFNIPSTSYGVPFPSTAYTLPGSSYEGQQFHFGNNLNAFQQGQYTNEHNGYLDPRTASNGLAGAGFHGQADGSGLEHHEDHVAFGSEQNYQAANADSTNKSN